MGTLFEVAKQNLTHRRTRSLLMMFFVLLLSGTFFVSTLLMDSMEKSIAVTRDRMGADVILVSKEYSQDLQTAMFSGEPCTLYLGRDWVEKAAALEGAERVSSQMYIATLGAGCCDVSTQLIAFDPETDFIIKPWLERGELELKTGEVVVGSRLVVEPGDPIMFYGARFTVAAKMEKTGMSYDNSVFMSYETARQLSQTESGKKNLNLSDFDQMTSMVMMTAKEGTKPEELVHEFSGLYYKEPVTAVTANRLVSDAARNIRQFSVYSVLLTGLLLVTTVLALMTIFTITIHERLYEFGILASIGATRGQIVGGIVLEALLISAAGGLLGAALAWGGVFLFQNLLRVTLKIPYLDTPLGTCLPTAGKCMLIALGTGLLASAWAAWQISRKETDTLIREQESCR